MNSLDSFIVPDPDSLARPCFAFGGRRRAHKGPWHSHRCAQLIHASDGAFTIHTEQGVWIVPPQRGVWILPGIRHRVTSEKDYFLLGLYADSNLLRLPERCCVVSIDSLENALLRTAAEFGPDYLPGGQEERLLRTLLDRLSMIKVSPLQLPEAKSSRLCRLTALLRENPAESRPLEAVARAVGLTGRTAERLFIRETGLTFGQWRQQLRLIVALERLEHGASVSSAARAVGYSDASAFIVVFKKAFGYTPLKYLRA